ncbi:hypothetical protein LINPERPRIM_LOCUS39300 [Linum perenne]
MKTNNKKRRVAAVSTPNQSESLEDDEETRFRARQKVLFQDFLKLQKEFVSKKKQLEFAKERRQTLLQEVEFLRRRHTHLLKMQSDEQEQEQVQQQQERVTTKTSVKRKSANSSLDTRGGKKKKNKKTDEDNNFLARHELSFE